MCSSDCTLPCVLAISCKQMPCLCFCRQDMLQDQHGQADVGYGRMRNVQRAIAINTESQFSIRSQIDEFFFLLWCRTTETMASCQIAQIAFDIEQSAYKCDYNCYSKCDYEISG